MPASGKINVEPLADFSNIARQTDLSALPESEWLGRCLERNNELPIEQAGMEQQLDDLWFEVLPRSEEDWLNQPLERDIELPVGQPYERPLTKLFAEGTSQSVPLWIEHGFEKIRNFRQERLSAKMSFKSCFPRYLLHLIFLKDWVSIRKSGTYRNWSNLWRTTSR